MSSKSVIVIGGGLAGLSSAVALAEAGFRVRLLEKRPHLGGRAASYVLPGGEHVDNCQHVTLGCCTNLEDFYRRVGAADQIRFFDRLLFAAPDGQRGAIASVALPPPLHMAPSFAFFPLLGWADKRAIAQALLAIARSGGQPGGSFERASRVKTSRCSRGCKSIARPTRAIRRFWEVILVSALDEELDRIDARYGIDVFWKAFLSTRGGYRVGIPRVPLGELYEGCRKALAAQGGEVQLRAGVRGFLVVDGRVEGVEREDGSVETADYYLAAVPQDVLPELLPAEVVEREPVFSNLRNLRTSPITGVHLWFDRTVMSEPFLTLLDSTTQWVFNKTQLYGGGAKDGGQYLAAGDQRVVQPGFALAAGNYRAVPRGTARCASRNSRGRAREGNRGQGNVRDVFAGARFGPVASRAEKSPLGIISRRGLDIDRLAVHNGGSRPQRLPGRRSDSLRCRNATEIIAAGFARGRIGAPVGTRNREKQPANGFDPQSTILGFLRLFTVSLNIRLACSDSEYDWFPPGGFPWTGSISTGATRVPTSPKKKKNVSTTKAIHDRNRSDREHRAWSARLHARAVPIAAPCCSRASIRKESARVALSSCIAASSALTLTPPRALNA